MRGWMRDYRWTVRYGFFLATVFVGMYAVSLWRHW